MHISDIFHWLNEISGTLSHLEVSGIVKWIILLSQTLSAPLGPFEGPSFYGKQMPFQYWQGSTSFPEDKVPKLAICMGK